MGFMDTKILCTMCGNVYTIRDGAKKNPKMLHVFNIVYCPVCSHDSYVIQTKLLDEDKNGNVGDDTM